MIFSLSLSTGKFFDVAGNFSTVALRKIAAAFFALLLSIGPFFTKLSEEQFEHFGFLFMVPEQKVVSCSETTRSLALRRKKLAA